MRVDSGKRPISPKVDFSDWDWNDALSGVAEKIADTIWQEITDSVAKMPPALSVDGDGDRSPCIAACLLDGFYCTSLIVPLHEIVLDEFAEDLSPEDGRRVIETLQGWIVTIETMLKERDKT
jgi:hypothetical protein